MANEGLCDAASDWLSYLRYVLERIADPPMNRIDEFLPRSVVHCPSVGKEACGLDRRLTDVIVLGAPSVRLR
jgi:hypothetical protein